MRIDHVKKSVAIEWTEQILKSVRDEEAVKYGCSNSMVICLFLIFSLGITLSALMFRGIIEDAIGYGVGVLIFSLAILAVKTALIGEKLNFYREEKKFRKYYRKLSEKLAIILPIIVAPKKLPLKVPEAVFKMTIEYLDKTDCDQLKKVDRGCFSILSQKDLGKCLSRLSEHMWSEMNNVLRKEVTNEEQNNQMWRHWNEMQQHWSEREIFLPGMANGNHFGLPWTFGLTEDEKRIKNLHSRYKHHHERLLPQFLAHFSRSKS